MSEDRRDRFLGRLVGNYRVERKLGEGGMGAVYLLKHTTLPDTYQALKVLTGEGANSERAKERFRQEALAAAAVGSHRVAKPIDLGQFEDGTPYIVMEFVAGRSLDGELRERKVLPLDRALKIATRVADTMAVAHQQGVVHRDLKPANIMLPQEGERDGQIKILDFGVARASGEHRVAVTTERSMIGTPGYMSPEAVFGATVDGRTDVFALGVILYEMLSGRRPFLAPTVEATLMMTVSEAAPPLASLRPAGSEPLPPEVEEIVAKALSKKADDRYTMVELHGALQSALDEVLASAGPRQIQSFRVAIPRNIFDSPTLANGQEEVVALLDRLNVSTPQPRTPQPRTPPPRTPPPGIGPTGAMGADRLAPTTPERRPPIFAAAAAATTPVDAALPRRRGALLLAAAFGLLLLIGGAVAISRRGESPARVPPVAAPQPPTLPAPTAAAAPPAAPSQPPAVTTAPRPVVITAPKPAAMRKAAPSGGRPQPAAPNPRAPATPKPPTVDTTPPTKKPVYLPPVDFSKE